MKNLQQCRVRAFAVALVASSGLLATAAPVLATDDAPAGAIAFVGHEQVVPTGNGPGEDDDDSDERDDDEREDRDDDEREDRDDDEREDSDDREDSRSDEKPEDDPRDSDRDSRDKDSGDEGGGRDSDQQSPGRGTDDPDSSEVDDSRSETKKQPSTAKSKAQKKAEKKAKEKAKTAAKKAAKKAKENAKKKAKAQAQARARAAQKAKEQRRSAVADDRDDPGSGGGIDSMRAQILNLANRARASAGCGPLRYSTTLQRSAQSHAQDMSAKNYMSHTSKSGRDFDQRIRSTGYDGNKTGENLGEGFSSAQAVHNAWMNSPSHRRNILDCKFRLLGVGYASSGGYWVQHFGS